MKSRRSFKIGFKQDICRKILKGDLDLNDVRDTEGKVIPNTLVLKWMKHYQEGVYRSAARGQSRVKRHGRDLTPREVLDDSDMVDAFASLPSNMKIKLLTRAVRSMFTES